ncbi:CoA transferase [Chelativorans sp. AA-79]|uniref:CaiB/BaiF CoA transferase family protein n=1 Tax=Chelativorans sp. AA-79 TaxID=3028735 RepID=UPI0023F7F2CD|nr:CoA transferase [Chelativorans sp. AA-79]WEX12452.1 CoA transferase [Chelativorans sp. AA-79]
MTHDLPLHGVRIIDFTWVGAGPLTTRILADFGAEVIKIESRSRPDVLRITPPLAASGVQYERSGYFAARNANKKSVALDMSVAAGRDLARRLIADADVIANSFAPGVMARWGLGYEDVAEIKPDIVYLEMPMLGSEGPYKNFTGFGATLMAVSGLLNLCGYPDRPPVGTGTNYPDHVPNPMHAAFAVLAALIHRRATGEGQKIEVSQLESTINVIGSAFVRNGHEEPVSRSGNLSRRFSPHGVYPCEGDDQWVAVAVEGETQWQTFCEVVGQPRLTSDPRFSSHDLRVANAEVLDSIIAVWTTKSSSKSVMHLLQAKGIAAGVVNDAATLVEGDPNIAALECFKVLPHSEMGPSRYLRAPIRMSRTPARLERSAPLLGEHSFDVCRDLLAMTNEEIDAATAAGAFG